MELFHDITLYIHIAAGTVAFVAAPVALATRKGGRNHRRFGLVYFWAMAVITLSGLALSFLLANAFLFFVGFFSFYLVISGYRWVFRKNPKQKVEKVDWSIHLTGAFFCAALVLLGIWKIVNTTADSFGYISVVFGLIGLNFAWINIRQLKNPPKGKGAWLFNHIGGMIGGYIATLSAFSAVNMHFLPTILQWLWPTILGVPVIYAFNAYYRRKMNAGKKVEELVELKGRSNPSVPQV